MSNQRSTAKRPSLSDSHFERFGACLDRCESYVDRKFLHAIVWAEPCDFTPEGGGSRIGIDINRIELHQQIDIEDFRIDFGFVRGTAKLAVEIDGHEFHHADREKVDADNARTLSLAKAGWTVVRFSGRAINTNARECAREAYAAAKKLASVAGEPIVQPRREPEHEGPRMTPAEMAEKARELLAALDNLR